MNFYYQRAKGKVDSWLPGQWLCCGGVDEISKAFYLNHFSKFDTRFDSMGCKPPENFEVIIVKGFKGKVINRAELTRSYPEVAYEVIPFDEAVDVLEKYNH